LRILGRDRQRVFIGADGCLEIACTMRDLSEQQPRTGDLAIESERLFQMLPLKAG